MICFLSDKTSAKTYTQYFYHLLVYKYWAECVCT